MPRLCLFFSVWLFVIFSAASAQTEPQLWQTRADALDEFNARGWNSSDLTLKKCETRQNEMYVCRYGLFATADVFAFAHEEGGPITALSVACKFSKCTSDAFRAFAVYVMRAANSDTDDILTLLLASAFAKKLVTGDGMIFSGFKNEDSYVLVMKLM